MTSSAISNRASQSFEGYSDFLTYLRGKFNNEEASAFSTSFATFLQEKADEYCIDLDEAYTWLGYAQKGKAVELIQKVGLHEDIDFSLSRPGKRNLPTKYMLKPDSFKKLLLAAQTKESEKAANYFIKIERAIQEFQSEGGVQFSPQPREGKRKTLALEFYTEELKNPVHLTSAGYNNDLSDPQLYLGIPRNVKFPPGVIPEGAAVVEFGWTSSSGKRFEAHRKSHGEFISLDHFPCPDAPGLENEWIRILEILGVRVYGKRQDGSKNTELFTVVSQAEYASYAARIYEAQQRMMSSMCRVQGEREKRLTAEAELAREKEKTRQVELQEREKTRRSEAELAKEKEKTVQILAECEARKSEAAARKAEAEASACIQPPQVSVCDDDIEEDDQAVFDTQGVDEASYEVVGGHTSPVHDEPIHIDQNESENYDAEFELTRRLYLTNVDEWIIRNVENDTLPPVILSCQLAEILKRDSSSVTWHLRKYEGHGMHKPKKERLSIVEGSQTYRGSPIYFDKRAVRHHLSSLQLLRR